MNGEINIELIEERDNDITLTVTNSDNTAYNLTGHSVYFMVKNDVSDLDADAVIDASVTSISNPTLGIVTIPINYTKSNVSTGNYFYEVVMKTPSQRITLSRGQCKITWSLKKTWT